MRKFLVVLMIAALAVTLTACSYSYNKPRNNNLERIICLSPSEGRLEQCSG